MSQQRDLLFYLKHLKEQIRVSEERSSALLRENQSLKIRAAVAWEEFTPRANFQKTYDVLDLNSSEFLGKSSKQILSEITEHFEKKIEEISQNSLKESCLLPFSSEKSQRTGTRLSTNATSVKKQKSRQNSMENSFINEQETLIKSENFSTNLELIKIPDLEL